MLHTRLKMKASIRIILTVLCAFLFSSTEIFGQDSFYSKDGSLTPVVPSDAASKSAEIYPKFVLHPNFPNPVTGYMNIKYEVKEPGHYIVSIVGIKGQELKRLVDKNLQKGEYKIHWAASPKAHGVYMYKINNGIPTEHRQLLLLKY